MGTVDRLLQEGLDLYQSGLVDHAVAVWTEAVHVQPDDPRPRDYLRQAGVSVDETDSPVPMHGTRAELEQLLAERRYEEALELLFAARRQNPSAPEISRGIQLLKQRLVRRYLHQIGNLDHVPKLAITESEVDERKLEEEERELLRLVDGISSFGDIAHESRLGRFETFRILAKLVGDQVITQAVEDREEEEELGVAAAPATAVTMVAEIPDASEVGPTPEEMSGETSLGAPLPQPHRRTWPLLLGLGLVGIAGLLVYFFLGHEQSTVPPEATAAAPAAAAAAPPVLTAPEPAPPIAVVVTPDAPKVAAEPEPEPEIEIEPPASPASPPTPARPARPRPPVRVAATRTPAAKPEEPPASEPPTPTQTPDPTPTPTQTPDPTPPPNPNPNPTPPPAPTPTPPPARLDARASVSLESVAGALTRSEVDRALGRITPSFRTCYTSAASRAQRNAAATIRVAFVVDETGLAQNPEAGPAPLPGLSDCLRDTLRQLRTQLAPDVGVVRVAANVTFTPLGP